MANPKAVSDQLGEWFEIYNASSDAFDLEGLKISDEGIDAVELVSSLIIPSGDRLVFGPSATRADNGDVLRGICRGVRSCRRLDVLR